MLVLLKYVYVVELKKDDEDDKKIRHKILDFDRILYYIGRIIRKFRP